MEFLHASIALLASMVLILAGMVGWLYYQQTRLFQNMNSIVMVIGEMAQPRYIQEEPRVAESATQTEEAPAPAPEAPAQEEDDRVSVTEEAEVVDGPPGPIETDGLESKSKKELQDILTKRGVPFSRSDNKGALISILKAMA
jgi:hypothetical protein